METSVFKSNHYDISNEPEIGFSMQKVRDTTSELQLIIAVVCIVILLLPGIVLATQGNASPGTENTTSILPNVTNLSAIPGSTVLLVNVNTTGIEPNVTYLPVTPVPTVFMVHKNTTIPVNPPPLLIFDTPVIENLTSTVYGIADPGSVNVSIVSTHWDWGDDQLPENHMFPNSHVYKSSGTYSLSITALQSDGQTVTGITSISVGQPAIPTILPEPLNTSASGGPVMVIRPPVLTLLEPVIDRTNVILNGNLNPGSPDVIIESVIVDWNDGNFSKSADLPVSHQYYGYGIFTVSVRANQSDGQSTSKKITLELKRETPGIPEPGAPGPQPNNDQPIYFILLAAVIIIMALVIVGQWIIPRGRGSVPEPDVPKIFSARNGPKSENLPSSEELLILCSGTDVTPDVLDPVIRIAVEIAQEGREGQAIGTSFIVGDTENVLNYSKQFVLNPFHGYHEAERQITDVGIRGNIKEFAQLDGAFIITSKGVVEAAGRCITVDMSNVNLPGGMGSRHSSVAGITQVTKSIGVVVSQSGGLISIFKNGKIVYTIKS
jgi:DNA integrity scanning protein DisA with diadenylate cyclase activity